MPGILFFERVGRSVARTSGCLSVGIGNELNYRKPLESKWFRWLSSFQALTETNLEVRATDLPTLSKNNIPGIRASYQGQINDFQQGGRIPIEAAPDKSSPAPVRLIIFARGPKCSIPEPSA